MTRNEEHEHGSEEKSVSLLLLLCWDAANQSHHTSLTNRSVEADVPGFSSEAAASVFFLRFVIGSYLFLISQIPEETTKRLHRYPKVLEEFQLADKDECMQKFTELYINEEIGLEDQMESLRNLSKAAYYFCNAQYKEMKRPTNRPGPQDFIMLQYVGRTVDIIVVDANGCYFDA